MAKELFATAASALAALQSWYRTGAQRVCALHGAPGAGKGAVVEAFCASIPDAALRRVVVRGGRTAGAPFEHDLLLQLAGGLQLGTRAWGEDPRALRARLRSAISNWDPDDGEPPLLLALIDLDQYAAWPSDPGVSVTGALGPSVRVVATIAADRSTAEARVARAGIRLADVAWVEHTGFRLVELDDAGRERLAWAAVDGPGAPAWCAAIDAAVRANALFADAVTIAATVFEPLEEGELARLLAVEQHQVIAAFDAHPGAAGALLRRDAPPRVVRFRHEALRRAWLRADPARATRWREELGRVASELLRARVGGDQVPQAIGYTRRRAGDHLLEVGAPDADMLRLTEPRWAWPASLADLGARRAELRRVRDVVTWTFEGRRAPAPGADQLMDLVRVALAQGALGTLAATWNLADDRPGDAVWRDAEPPLVTALLALAGQASEPVRRALAQSTVERARRSAPTWATGAATLLELAEVAGGAEAAGFGRLAMVALDREGIGVDPRRLVAARHLPADEAEAVVSETLLAARSSPQPGRALAALAPTASTDRQAMALFHTAMDLEGPSRANALAPLLTTLPTHAAARAVSAIVHALGEDDAAQPEPLDAASAAEAVARYLSVAEIEALLRAPHSGVGEVFAVRLAELGEPARAREVIDELCGGGVHGARALLRSAATPGGSALAASARDAVSKLSPTWSAASLVADHAAEAISVLGRDGCVQLIDLARQDASAYGRIAALCALCAALPQPERPALATLAIEAYRAEEDPEALQQLLRCARWFEGKDAAWLVARTLGDASTAPDWASTLAGWGGLEQLAPLIARVGGDAALTAASEAVADAARWVAIDTG